MLWIRTLSFLILILPASFVMTLRVVFSVVILPVGWFVVILLVVFPVVRSVVILPQLSSCSGASRRTETCNIPLFQSAMLTCYSQVHSRFRLRQSRFLSHSSRFFDLRSKIDFSWLYVPFLLLLTQSQCCNSMSNPSTLFSGRPFEASEDAVFERALQDGYWLWYGIRSYGYTIIRLLFLNPEETNTQIAAAAGGDVAVAGGDATVHRVVVPTTTPVDAAQTG